MVLTRKVGTERPFGLVALLYVLTFGLYGVYWHYKVQNELYKQFELHQEARDEGALWLLYGHAVFRPLIWVFLYVLVDNVQHVRARFGMPPRPGAGRVLGLAVTGALLGYAGGGALYAGLALALAEEPLEGDTLEETQALGLVLLATGAVLLLAAAVFLVLAYAPLQAAINEVWRAYDARMARLRPDGGAGRQVTPGPPGPPPAPVRPWPGAPSGPGGGSSPGGPSPPGWSRVR